MESSRRVGSKTATQWHKGVNSSPDFINTSKCARAIYLKRKEEFFFVRMHVANFCPNLFRFHCYDLQIWSNTNLPSYRDKVADEGGKKSIYDNRFPIILWLEDVFHNLSHPQNYYLRTSLSPRDVFGTAFRCLCKFLSPDWYYKYVFVCCRGRISWLGIFISHNNLKLFPWSSGARRGNRFFCWKLAQERNTTRVESS